MVRIVLLVLFSLSSLLLPISAEPLVKEMVAEIMTPVVSEAYSSEGTLFATFLRENRRPIPSSSMPSSLLEATRLIEGPEADLARQLAGFYLARGDRSVKRRLARERWAARLQEELSDEQIMELYLNSVYLGEGAYGVEAASSLYFGVPTEELTLWQSALLIAVAKSPSQYSPLREPQRALTRLGEVLDALEKDGRITAEDSHQAMQAARVFQFERFAPNLQSFPQLTSHLRRLLNGILSEEQIWAGGLRIQTTYSLELQREAKKILEEELPQGVWAALVILNDSGDVQAVVGRQGKFDLASQLALPYEGLKKRVPSSFQGVNALELTLADLTQVWSSGAGLDESTHQESSLRLVTAPGGRILFRKRAWRAQLEAPPEIQFRSQSGKYVWHFLRLQGKRIGLCLGRKDDGQRDLDLKVSSKIMQRFGVQ